MKLRDCLILRFHFAIFYYPWFDSCRSVRCHATPCTMDEWLAANDRVSCWLLVKKIWQRMAGWLASWWIQLDSRWTKCSHFFLCQFGTAVEGAFADANHPSTSTMLCQASSMVSTISVMEYRNGWCHLGRDRQCFFFFSADWVSAGGGVCLLQFHLVQSVSKLWLIFSVVDLFQLKWCSTYNLFVHDSLPQSKITDWLN